MRNVFLSFVALVLSFGHAQTARHTEANAFVPPAPQAAGFVGAVPSHREIVSADSSYAGGGCPGCRTTNTTSSTR